MTIRFTLKSAIRKDGKQALMLRITNGRSYTKWVGTDLNIDAKHWDTKQERCKKSHPASTDLNREIAKFKTKRETALAKFDAGTITLERIPKYLKGLADYKSLDEYVLDKIEEDAQDVTFEDYVSKLSVFKNHLGITGTLEFKELDNALFKKFIKVCHSRRLQRDSVLSYLRAITGICSKAFDEDVIFEEIKVSKLLKKSIKNPSRIRKPIRTVPTDEFLRNINKIKTIQQWQSMALWLLQFGLRGLYNADLVKMTKEEIDRPNIVSALRNETYIQHLRSKSEHHNTHSHMRIHLDKHTTLPLLSMVKRSIVYTTLKFHPDIIPPAKDHLKLFDYNPTERSKFHKSIWAVQQRRLKVFGMRFKDARKTFTTEAKALAINEDTRKILVGRMNDPLFNQAYDNNEDKRISDAVQNAHKQVLESYNYNDCVDALIFKLDDLKVPKWIRNNLKYHRGFVAVAFAEQKKGWFSTVRKKNVNKELDAIGWQDYKWEEVIGTPYEDYFRECWHQTPKEKKKMSEELEKYKVDIDLYYDEQIKESERRKKREEPLRKYLKELEIETSPHLD
jgi:hypothetical protein